MINTPQKLLPALAKAYHGSSRERKIKHDRLHAVQKKFVKSYTKSRIIITTTRIKIITVIIRAYFISYYHKQTQLYYQYSPKLNDDI